MKKVLQKLKENLKQFFTKPEFHSVYGILAVFVLFFVFILHLLEPDSAFSAQEMRTLKTFPRFSFEALTEGRFPRDTETWFTDQFPGRDLFMRIRAEEAFLTGVREMNGVYYLKSGRLAERFDTPDVQLMQETAETVNTFAGRHSDSSFYMMTVPTAVSIYEDELPLEAVGADQNAYIDDFMKLLSESVHVLNVRDALRAEAAAGNEVYYRSDHHWTTGACLAVYDAIRPTLDYVDFPVRRETATETFLGSLYRKSGFRLPAKDRIELVVPEDETFRYYITDEETGETLTSCYQPEALDGGDGYSVFFGGNVPILRIETTVDTERSLLVFKDSFANAFLPLLFGQYGTIVVVDPRYYSEQVESLLRWERFSDVLFLYNATTLSTDTELKKVLE